MLTVASGVCGLVAGPTHAGVVTGPTATDTFPSIFEVSLFLQPAYTSLGSEVQVNASGGDFPGTKAHVVRELNAFNGFFGTDTVDLDFQSMHLAGSVLGPFGLRPFQFKVGQGNGFRPGLGYSPGQVAETPSTPPDGKLNEFPARTVMDLFIDVWVDLNVDDIVDNGEVLRNFNQSLRMGLDNQTGKPPYGDVFRSIGWVSIGDPLLGEFGATVNTSRIDFYVVNPDGTNSGLVAAQLDPLQAYPSGIGHTHTVLPEPGSMAIFGGLALIAGRRQCKRWRSRLAKS